MNSLNRQTLIAALDIGSSKVSCVIARVSRDQKITIAGYGYNASKGIKNGMIPTSSRQPIPFATRWKRPNRWPTNGSNASSSTFPATKSKATSNALPSA